MFKGSLTKSTNVLLNAFKDLNSAEWHNVPSSTDKSVTSSSSPSQPILQDAVKRKEWKESAESAFLLALSLLSKLWEWMKSCFQILPQFYSPSACKAMYRMCLVLAASLFLIVVISTIDGIMLQLYVMGARKGG
ncbi:hypothetical protein CEUSTIGMA_g786.t1 [Chlamydomonas eustigma]|uniref:Uncharacterized protein n=1 Tax=Chlamydomonas eustigma TaxID=1157962 RepID=A0A250WRN5_9CHLO|nr:hypothetical protein CEUSTIGMA_g786.t1 [Chlamydomonas eustigma]|eukprot:GAX73332.1 hypothetical protein CEUSTIGMA_g786.t1 [Chlamydomonas eustigma]